MLKASLILPALAALALLTGSCGGSGHGQARHAAAPAVPRGGTLRVAMPVFDYSPLAAGKPVAGALDPQALGFYDSLEVLRCCLARTLVSYVGRRTDEGGATLRPDLATGLPDVSADGLTWTFRLKPGVHYGPPLTEVEMTARDVVRALERGARAENGALAALDPTYPLIAGYTAFARGRASSISGLETPDRHTLVIHLTQPAGDLATRLALPDAAPIPPNPNRPEERFGAAAGHRDGYGRFLVSTGPYMLAGSDRLDFSKTPREQLPAAGFVPARSITLVRNPSWRSSTDPLRPAHLDRIEISIRGTPEEAAKAVEADKADLVVYAGPPPQFPPEVVARISENPRRGRVEINTRDFLRYISMNLAVPPFDDIHVRKALNEVIDKDAVLRAQGGPIVGQPVGHIALTSFLNDALVSYEPYGAATRAERIARARHEMALSRYDRNDDGRCDAAVCRRVRALGLPTFVAIADQIGRDAGAIGLTLRVQTPADANRVFALLGDPEKHIPLAVNVGYGKDDLNGAGFFPATFARASIGRGGANWSLVGATPAQLRRWGYSVTRVPSVDDRIDECKALSGGTQIRCWTSLDQYLMEQVVPWVPLAEESHVDVIGRRIAHFSFDQLSTMPALEQIALRR